MPSTSMATRSLNRSPLLNNYNLMTLPARSSRAPHEALVAAGKKVTPEFVKEMFHAADYDDGGDYHEPRANPSSHPQAAEAEAPAHHKVLWERK